MPQRDHDEDRFAGRDREQRFDRPEEARGSHPGFDDSPGQVGPGPGQGGQGYPRGYDRSPGSPGWSDRQDASHGYSGGTDTGYGAQGGSGGFGPLSQGSHYAGSGSQWGRSGYGSDAGRARGGDDRPSPPDPGLSGRPGQGGGTYGQQDVSRSAQRSQWREEQRSPQSDRVQPTGKLDRGGPSAGEHAHDHEPDYIHWRNTRLESHDRDYDRWRDEQARKYDEEYKGFRGQRHETFSRDFHSWRSSQVSEASNAAAGTTPLTQSSDSVESVTDGHARTHAHGGEPGGEGKA